MTFPGPTDPPGKLRPPPPADGPYPIAGRIRAEPTSHAELSLPDWASQASGFLALLGATRGASSGIFG